MKSFPEEEVRARARRELHLPPPTFGSSRGWNPYAEFLESLCSGSTVQNNERGGREARCVREAGGGTCQGRGAVEEGGRMKPRCLVHLRRSHRCRATLPMNQSCNQTRVNALVSTKLIGERTPKSWTPRRRSSLEDTGNHHLPGKTPSIIDVLYARSRCKAQIYPF